MIIRIPSANRPLLLDEAPQGFVHALLIAMLIIELMYIFTFNWYPDLRLLLSSSLAGIHLLMSAITILLRPAHWHKPLLLCIAILILTLIPAHALGFAEVRGFDYNEVIRRLILPIMFIWILTYPLALPLRFLWWLVLIGTLLSAIIVYIEPPLYYNINDDGPRFPSITGGLDQIHPSAKFLALQVVLIDLLRRARIMHAYVAWVLIAICVYLLIGYGSRTQFVFLGVYASAIIYLKLRTIHIVRWLPFLGVILFTSAAIIAFNVGTDVDKWGSGRIGTWVFRLDLIAQRDLVTLLFGAGVGSDDIWTPTWGWADDTFISHNDYLFFLYDHGILGLFFPLFFLWALWIRTGEFGRAVVVAVAISAVFDNGYFRSPLLAAYLAVVCATALLVSLLATDSSDRRDTALDSTTIDPRHPADRTA